MSAETLASSGGGSLLRTAALLGLFASLPFGSGQALAKEAATEQSRAVARDTTTGKDFEKRIETALRAGGYQVSGQTQVGTRPNGGKHLVDVVARKDDTAILVSLKWQQTGGTAEQKIPYEMICLAEALLQSQRNPGSAGSFHKACIVMGGDGWTLRDWYLSGALHKHLPEARHIRLFRVEDFLAQAKAGTL